MASLADLQTEREALRATQAKADFEAALADTLTQADVLAAGLATRRIILDALDALVDDLLDAIEAEHDETRVHYRMTDAVLVWLGQLAQRCQAVASACPPYGTRLAAGMSPRRLLTVSQWANHHRKLATGTNLPGPWNTELTPYLREVMDSLAEHSPAQRVVFMKSVQVGATECLNNWLGYIMHHLRNKDCLVVVPTKEYRNQKFNPRLSRLMAESPDLAELITTASRNKKNTEDVLEYGLGAKIVKAGANVSTDLRSDPFPYIACDEIDEFPAEIPGSGDPMNLIEGRQTTFSRPKTFLISTPKVEGTSRIAAEYARSDRRRYHLPCPHCDTYQPLEWKQLKWDASKIEGQEDTPESERVIRITGVWYECAHCGQAIDEGHKTDMLARGKWVAERPMVSAIRGYHINALYAPVGLGLNWRRLAEKWLHAQGDSAALQTFVNERLGEVWREQAESIDNISLITRRENYQRDQLPLRLVTAGIDVQGNRLEISIVGWGDNEEAWLLDHIILPGDTAQEDIWFELDLTLADANVDHAVIDSGFNTSFVYTFCQTRAWCTPGKGVAGINRPLIEDETRRAQRLRRRAAGANTVEPLGVDQGKSLIFARLKPKQGPDGQTLVGGPTYIHFPNTPAFDVEYFEQLASERLLTRYKGHRAYQEWVKTRKRNEALDCLVYAFAAMRLTGVDLAPPAAAPAPAQPAARRGVRYSLQA